MSDTPTNRATEFLAAYNDIEQHLRGYVDGKNWVNFPSLVKIAKRNKLINNAQGDDLLEFNELRNAISHGEYRNMRPIAEPLPETVAEIEAIRDQVLHPPQAMKVLGHQEVTTFQADDDIREALATLRTTLISQFPIYDDGKYVALLTTNTIARWVAADLDDNDHLDARTVREVLAYAEDNDRAAFLSRDASALEAIDLLTQPGQDGALPRALIVTEHGRRDQRPFRVIGGSDLLPLLASVGKH